MIAFQILFGNLSQELLIVCRNKNRVVGGKKSIALHAAPPVDICVDIVLGTFVPCYRRARRCREVPAVVSEG